jgi:Polyketide cyclase / dehydrase and lipid transport
MKRSIIFIVALALLGLWFVQELVAIELSKKEQEKLVEGETIVSLKTIKGPIKEGTVIGLIDAPPERVFKIVTDNDNFEEFMPYVTQSDVEQGEEGAIINYQHLDFPFPVGDRYYKINIINTIESKKRGQVFISAWTYVKGSGNIDDTYGSWILEEYNKGKTLVTYIVCTDIGGWIPSWAQNMATEIALPEIIERVRQQEKNPRYEDQ